MRRLVCAAGVSVLLAACGSSDSRTVRLVRVAPAADPSCGEADDGRTLLVTALGDFAPSEATGRSRDLSQTQTFSLDSFPESTRVLEVVVIGAGGVTRRTGRTAEFELTALRDGDELSVFMAPPRGFCPTGVGGATARIGPLMARAGGGALVVGGTGSSGQPVTDALLYDPATGAFQSVGDGLYGDSELGLIGASMTELPDGRVVVVGGAAPAYQWFEPGSDTDEAGFGLAAFLPSARAHHVAVALGGGRVLLAGGCSQLDGAGACRADSLLTTSSILDIDTGTVGDGPPLQNERISGRAFLEPDGRVLIVAGVDAAGQPVIGGERIDPTGAAAAESVDGGAGVAARLADGGVLLALGPVGGVASAAAGVIPAGERAASAVLSAPRARVGASATSLDDGRVLILGGLAEERGAEVLLYQPDDGSFESLAAVPDAGAGAIYRRDHAAVRLRDGSVLVGFGRTLGGEALGDTWIFRPDLTGRYSSDATLSFDVAAAGGLALSPRDPARFRRQAATADLPANVVLEASGSGGLLPSQWAVLAGPEFVSATLSVRARADNGGLALMIGFVDRDSYAAAILIPGQRAQLYRVVQGRARIDASCVGQVVEAGGLSPGSGLVTASLEWRAEALAVELDGAAVLSCTGLAPIARGLVGIGAVGAEGAELRLASLTVGR